MISAASIQDVLGRVDIVEYIGLTVTLKKQGRNYTGCCPFHDEKSPSFTVNPERGFYKCFGCGKSGDAIQFVMENEHLDFQEAVKKLAEKYTVVVDFEKTDGNSEKRKTIIDCNETAWKYFKHYGAELEGKFDRYNTSSTFDIGWCGANNPISKNARENGWLQGAKDAGLVKEHQGVCYDSFKDRVIIPVYNNAGHIVAFGGRALGDAKPKYINSPEHEAYSKSKTLYGLYQNGRSIGKQDCAIIVEGYFDVISLADAGLPIAVAPCGTAFTEDQARLLYRYTRNAVVWMDGDKAGTEATEKAVRTLLLQNFSVRVVRCTLPGKDPDDIARRGDAVQYLANNIEDAIYYYASIYMAKMQTAEDRILALHQMATLLYNINDEFRRKEYIKDITREYKLTKNDLPARIAALQNEGGKRQDLTIEDKADSSLVPPSQEDLVDYHQFGFWGETRRDKGFGYIFRSRDGNVKLTNFLLRPIFLLDDPQNARRVYEIENEYGKVCMLELPVDSLSSVSKFSAAVESLGNFVFHGNQQQINKMKMKLYASEEMCKPVSTLGWHYDGFWAWANGVYHLGQFIAVDRFGRVKFGDKQYFIPALSQLYQANRKAYKEEKKFQYKPNATVSPATWSDLFLKVHGRRNGIVGIAYLCAATFRDHIFNLPGFSMFPHLFLYGEPGTGKSQEAESLISLYGERQEKIALPNVTHVGIGRKLSKFTNALVWGDEYKNSLDPVKIEVLKNAFDGTGRIQGIKSIDDQTTTTEINSALVISGQEKPTADIALYTRCVLISFVKRKFELVAYNMLKEQEGLASTTVLSAIIDCRADIEKNYEAEFRHSLDELNPEVPDIVSSKDRMVRSFAILMAAYRVVSKSVTFSFNEKEVISALKETLRKQVADISNSNEVSTWWDCVESLFANAGKSGPQIRDNQHFKIQRETRGGMVVDILYLRYSLVWAEYSKHYRQAYNKPGMDKSSLLDYLKSSDSYIDTVSSTNFRYKPDDHRDGYKLEVSSAFLFDYGKLSKNINLVSENVSGDQAAAEDKVKQLKLEAGVSDESNGQPYEDGLF